MHTTSPSRALLTVAALTLLCAALVRDAGRPPAPVPASAPATEFSAERAMRHVREIAQRPHPVGSADNARVREYLQAELRALGLDPQVQDATGVGTRYPAAGRVKNVLARLAGTTPGGQAVALMSHYDGVGGGPAAGDAAAGTAAILETLRALRAGPPLAHDVIALITDGEEAGLLGAAAFVREHPWARDVGVTLNFEARGTRGRAFMFETGPGNLDVARVLRRAPDVSATSLSVTVYRTLPNDTDLSEVAVLGRPALNFAFADGVQRYHTAHDDVAHLDPGSVQHHGDQALALARAFGNGPLPRPATGDAVFFDVPLLGLIVYPERWAWPLSLAAFALVLAAALRLARRRNAGRWGRDMTLGTVGTLAAVALGGGAAALAGNAIGRLHASLGWGGVPSFRGVYSAAIVVLALAIALACWALVRRWASVAAAHVGALAVWGILALVVAWKAPGVSFLFAWPLLAAAIAAHVSLRRVDGEPDRGAGIALWVATVIAAVVLVPVMYGISAVLLGAVGAGGIAAAVLTALLAWLLIPLFDAIGAGHPWRAALGATVAAAVLFAVGMTTVRRSPAHPAPSLFAYALDTSGIGAWVAARGADASQLGGPNRASATTPPPWLARAIGSGRNVAFASAPRLSIDLPSATVLADSTGADGKRRLSLRLRAAPGTETLAIRADGAPVLAAEVDGRAIDTSRYRARPTSWRLDYSAPPDSGVMLVLTLPAGGSVSLDLTARLAGLPALPGVTLPPRPPGVVTSQTGDVTIAHRVVRVE